MDYNNLERLDFDNPAQLAAALSDRVAAELSVAISERGQAFMAVSGGRTPELFFHYLAKADIAWEHITITLVDERFVPTDDERSNELFVRKNLLQHFAQKAKFIGLYTKAVTAELAAFSAASRINSLPKPFDVVILGMGVDGHTASFFPGGDRLRQAIDPTSRAFILPMHAKGAGEPRLTMTLPLLISARFLALQLEGHGKLASFEQALKNGADKDMPIRAVLNNLQRPLKIYWSPAEGDRHEPPSQTLFD